MLSFGQLIVITAVLATAYGQNVYVNSSARDYLRLAQRELLHTIDAVDNEIVTVEARSADRLDVVEYQQKQSLSEIRRVNSSLVSLQALGLIRKHCIQTHSPQLKSYIDVESQMKVCYGSAELIAKQFIAYARNNAELARQFATSELNRIIASCDYYYGGNQTALELCYIEYVTMASSVVDNYLNKAQEDLRSSLFYSSDASKTGVKCTFNVEKETLLNIEQTSQQIRECEESLNSLSLDNITPSKILEVGIQRLLSGRRGGS